VLVQINEMQSMTVIRGQWPFRWRGHFAANRGWKLCCGSCGRGYCMLWVNSSYQYQRRLFYI